MPLLHSRVCFIPKSVSPLYLFSETSNSMHGKLSQIASFSLTATQLCVSSRFLFQFILAPSTQLHKLETSKSCHLRHEPSFSRGHKAIESAQSRAVTPPATRVAVSLLGPARHPCMGSPARHLPCLNNCPRDKWGEFNRACHLPMAVA